MSKGINTELWKKIGQQVLVTTVSVIVALYIKEALIDKIVAKIEGK